MAPKFEAFTNQEVGSFSCVIHVAINRHKQELKMPDPEGTLRDGNVYCFHVDFVEHKENEYDGLPEDRWNRMKELLKCESFAIVSVKDNPKLQFAHEVTDTRWRHAKLHARINPKTRGSLQLLEPLELLDGCDVPDSEISDAQTGEIERLKEQKSTVLKKLSVAMKEKSKLIAQVAISVENERKAIEETETLRKENIRLKNELSRSQLKRQVPISNQPIRWQNESPIGHKEDEGSWTSWEQIINRTCSPFPTFPSPVIPVQRETKWCCICCYSYSTSLPTVY